MSNECNRHKQAYRGVRYCPHCRIESQQATIDELKGSLVSLAEADAKRITSQQANITEQSKVIERVTIAANEMHHDNVKGDFYLPNLARIDLDGILAALKEKT